MTDKTDIVERLLDISQDDHMRGCNGRNYICDCGFDSRSWKTADDAAEEIKALRKQVERLAHYERVHIDNLDHLRAENARLRRQVDEAAEVK